MTGATILLVTWFIGGQPPSSYQTQYSGRDACNQAKAAVVAEQQRLIGNEADYVAQIKAKGVIQMPRSIYVSAVCTPQ